MPLLPSSAAFFLGFFVAIGAFNALLYLVARDAPFGWYAAAMFALVGVTSVAAGANFPAPELVSATSLSLYWLTLTGFCRAFLGVRRTMRGFDVLTVPVLLAAGAAPFVAAGAPPHGLRDAFGDVAQAALIVLLVARGISARAEGFRPARFYLLAFAFLAVGVAIDDTNHWGPLLHGLDLSAAFDGGLALQALLFALALADRGRAVTALVALDGLTGIPNRRSFDSVLREAWERARRAHLPLGVLMIDVDHFKRYNDGYGHQAGDEVLRRVARAVQDAALRPDDAAARYGGEEFAAVLPLADLESARAIGERVRHNVRALAIPYPAVVAGIITVSIGAASVRPTRALTPEQLLTAADRALYRAKEEGRDRVVAGDVGASTPDPGLR
ncbi:MAG TPA: diguanylate cyclase [Candidatus Sulfotelmatobacter sp.]|nr:diguanylate cyclase [Candidatus Sulfotelmatobacter sp.]